MGSINEVAELVEKGKAKLVGAAVQDALDSGCDPTEILNKGMIDAMAVVGDLRSGNAGCGTCNEKRRRGSETTPFLRSNRISR